jgi:hypothetical protein
MGGKMNTFEFDALFGSPTETKKAAAVRPEPALPWDDPLWSFTSPSRASADACTKIEHDAFLKGILGEMPRPVTPEPVTFEKIFAAPKASSAELTQPLTKKRDRAKGTRVIVQLADGTTLANPTYDKQSRCWWQDGVRFAGDLVSIEVK